MNWTGTAPVAESPRELKVLHLLYALRMGGTELGVVKVANGLSGSGIRSAICSCQPADALKSQLHPSVRLHEFNKRDGNDPVFVWQLARLIRRERPDVVHTHSWGTLCEGVAASRLAGVPAVVHGEHGTMEMRPRNIGIQRFVWKRLDGVLSVSSRLAERMASVVGYPLERIRVIRNGIDTERFCPTKRAHGRRVLGLPNGELVIGTAGRLVPVKDQASLLRCLATLKSRGVGFTCLIAGDGPLRRELSALADSLGLSEQVRFLGERKDIESVLAALDLFVLSSVSEGLSNTTLEAMGSGVAVVSTRVGGADELVHHERTGLLVPPGEPAALADAVERIARRPDERIDMGRLGRERTEGEFSMTAMLSAYAGLYASVAGTRVTAPCVA